MNARLSLVVLAMSMGLAGAVYASEEEFLKWAEVRIVSPQRPDTGRVVFAAKTDGDQYQQIAIEAFGRKHSVGGEVLAKLKGFPLNSLVTTHEAGYAELGGHTVHFKFKRSYYKEGKLVQESVVLSVSKGKGLVVSGPQVQEARPKAMAPEKAGADSARATAKALQSLPAPRPAEPTQRQVNVVVSGQVTPAVVKSGEPIPLSIRIANGLRGSIYHETFSVKPNDWNGETVHINLVDIYRNGVASNLYRARPAVKQPPMPVSGMGALEIKPGSVLEVKTDARKWQLRDGWIAGRYRVTLRVDRLRADPYCTLSVLSDPVEFEIK